MAKNNWRKDPGILAAKEFANKFNKDAVIILSFNKKGIQSASYGRNKKFCDVTARLMNNLMDDLQGTNHPFALDDLSNLILDAERGGG